MADVITLAKRGGRAFWTWFGIQRRKSRMAPVLGRYSVTVPHAASTAAPLALARVYGGEGSTLSLGSGSAALFEVVGSWLRLKAGAVLVAGTYPAVVRADPVGPGQTVSLRAFVLTVS